jgi:hypothetical protein
MCSTVWFRGELAMQRRSMLYVMALVVLATVPILGGCYVYGGGAVVVDSPPPPPRQIVVHSRPGFVFVRGYWQRRGSSWMWVDGYWMRERPGQIYVQGRWLRRGGRYHWVSPHWRSGSRGVGYREYRRRDDRRQRAPAVRDHR